MEYRAKGLESKSIRSDKYCADEIGVRSQGMMEGSIGGSQAGAIYFEGYLDTRNQERRYTRSIAVRRPAEEETTFVIIDF